MPFALYYNCIVQFQFLIGSLKTLGETRQLRAGCQFQFLIGSLKTTFEQVLKAFEY